MKFGLRGMDEDHERIISLAKEVEAQVHASRPLRDIREKFHELVEYSVAHFGREEKYMLARGYPDMAVHKREHEELGEWLDHLEKALAQDGPGARLAATEQALHFFRAWIERHLMEFDQPLAAFLIARAERADFPLQNRTVFDKIL